MTRMPSWRGDLQGPRGSRDTPSCSQPVSAATSAARRHARRRRRAVARSGARARRSERGRRSPSGERPPRPHPPSRGPARRGPCPHLAGVQHADRRRGGVGWQHQDGCARGAGEAARLTRTAVGDHHARGARVAEAPQPAAQLLARERLHGVELEAGVHGRLQRALRGGFAYLAQALELARQRPHAHRPRRSSDTGSGGILGQGQRRPVPEQVARDRDLPRGQREHGKCRSRASGRAGTCITPGRTRGGKGRRQRAGHGRSLHEPAPARHPAPGRGREGREPPIGGPPIGGRASAAGWARRTIPAAGRSRRRLPHAVPIPTRRPGSGGAQREGASR
jgi:hypothetical protein